MFEDGSLHRASTERACKTNRESITLCVTIRLGVERYGSLVLKNINRFRGSSGAGKWHP